MWSVGPEFHYPYIYLRAERVWLRMGTVRIVELDWILMSMLSFRWGRGKSRTRKDVLIFVKNNSLSQNFAVSNSAQMFCIFTTVHEPHNKNLCLSEIGSPPIPPAWLFIVCLELLRLDQGPLGCFIAAKIVCGWGYWWIFRTWVDIHTLEIYFVMTYCTRIPMVSE